MGGRWCQTSSCGLACRWMVVAVLVEVLSTGELGVAKDLILLKNRRLMLLVADVPP